MGSLVSLVMSDIVDSTRRWNAAEGAMAADLELHDRLIREVVEGAGGSVFKHTGDGMIAVFDDPVAAVSAAAGVQQAIGSAQWQQPEGLRVRAGVHTGVVYPRDGDLFGTAVNKVARLLGVCPPGAVLVSGATTGLLTDRAPEGLALQPIGPVPLAGFATPDDTHALAGAGLAEVASVMAEPVPTRVEIPSIDDELVGRTEELSAIWEALLRTRLVTLVGVGGMGKTRLALELAAGGVAALDGAVWWIDLANATSARAVVPVAMAATGARETPGRTALQSICDRLSGVDGIVVVDNCEHVLRAARDLVGAIRSAATGVRVVCTSREALGLRGEQIVAIGSLPVDDGTTLFRERARAVRPDLDLDANRAVIERICIRLDGIPLAIELAAARCRSMTPAEIDTRLDDRFRLLRGGRDGAERHRTLHAAVAWSYSLLDHDERTVFDQLAVFAGGTLIDGIAAVGELDEFDALDIVDRLVARSMVVATATPLGTRYHQLETLRQFAEDRLVEAGVIDEVRDRHLAWVHRLAEWIDACNGTPRAADGFRRFCGEVDNVRLAVAHARGTGRHHVSHEIVAAVGSAAYERPVFEVFDWARPVELEGDWTDVAAICAAWGAAADVVRGSRADQVTVGDVPERFVASNPVVARYAATVECVLLGRWSHALALLAPLPERTDHLGVAVDGAWFVAQYFRQIYGGPGADIDDEEWDVIRRRGEAAIATARRLGDELALGSLAYRLSWAIAAHDPSRAMELAHATEEIAERLGARMLSNYARFARLGAIDRLAASDAPDPATLAGLLRTSLVEAVDDGNMLAARGIIWSGSRLITAIDRAAFVTFVAHLRSTDPEAMAAQLPAWARRYNVVLPDDWTEWEQRAARLSEAEAIGLVIAALDRFMVEQSGGES
jgi:predicted ATPase/class 3 adenylate cyclase